MTSRILDKSFSYTPSARQTVEHLRQVFARERRRIAEQDRLAEQKPSAKVRELKAKGAK